METINTGDPFGGAMDPPMTRFQIENYVAERVSTLLHKSRTESAELEKLKREMAAHDGPPTKEENEKYMRLKYGPDNPAQMHLSDNSAIIAASTPGGLSKAANFASDDGALTSGSIGF